MQGRILVVHRNELILDVVQEMLQDMGYAVTLSCDGHRALGKAMSSHFNLIIINHTLSGGLTGDQLVERMRKYGVQAPIIGTAPDAGWEQSPELQKKIDYLLPAPFDYSELINAVETLLNPSRGKTSRSSIRDLEPDDLLAAPDLPDAPEPSDAIASLLPDPPDAPEPSPPLPETLLPPQSASLDTFLKKSGANYTVPQPARQQAPARILLVEANEALSHQITHQLKGSGYQVVAFKNGQAAYEDAMLNDYDLILTDLWIPGMDGFEMIEALRKSGVDAPIAILTSHITRDMVEELLAYRICRILLKPLKNQDLISLVQAKAV